MALGNLKSLSELAKVAKGKAGKQVLSVPVKDVVSKAQVRKRFRNIEELAATLVTEGQQSPIIVSPKGEDGKYIIQKGERRWRACKYAEIPNIDIIINEKIQDELDKTAGELIENIQRDDLTPLEIAEALETFIKAEWKQKDIALRLGVNNSFVSSHLSLLKMPDCVRELYDREISSDTESLNNLRLLYQLDPKYCRTICTVAITDGISRQQSRELLNETKRIHGRRGHSNLDPIDENARTDTGKATLITTKKQNKASRSMITEGYDANNTEWKTTRADKLIITVHVVVNDKIRKGVIMTDRVALNPSTVWVKMPDSAGKEIHLNVPISNIEILSVED